MSISHATRSRIPVTRIPDRNRREDLLEKSLAEVVSVVAPVWPLKDYVAVNPFAGVSHRSFLNARSFLRQFSDAEMLMPIEYFAAEFARGAFGAADVESAADELAATGVTPSLSVSQIIQNLEALGVSKQGDETRGSLFQNHRSIRTIAERANNEMSIDWCEAITEEISKYCAAHYDEEQVAWSSPTANLSLYQAWRATAVNDFNIEILGLDGFRKFVSELPDTPEAAIARSLKLLEVPPLLWSKFLLCQAYSIPGWSAWTKYQSSWTSNARAANDLVGLLAIRLAYDAALAKAKSLRINWASLIEFTSSAIDGCSDLQGGDTIVRYVLLRASEIAYRGRLLSAITGREEVQSKTNDRKLAQMVFCIDVRSERIRRQLESLSDDIETFGFAGFFGMPFEFAAMGQARGNLQLPVLLKPQFKVHEGIQESDSSDEVAAINQRQQSHTWRKLWKLFKSSSVSSFSFVESAGVLAGAQLFCRAMNTVVQKVGGQRHEWFGGRQVEVGPTLRGLCQQGITTSRQADIAEAMLRNLGLTKNFAELVVLCGHACQTENNPLAAGLDCGACGGHSGEPNAKFAALLLNQPYIRNTLAERGIQIPADTYFLAALHNTTTDHISIFDLKSVPMQQRAALQALLNSCEMATRRVQAERAPLLSSKSIAAVSQRANDWSEVRPEWGLAGNAAFIVARREVTKKST